MTFCLLQANFNSSSYYSLSRGKKIVSDPSFPLNEASY